MKHIVRAVASLIAALALACMGFWAFASRGAGPAESFVVALFFALVSFFLFPPIEQ